MNSVYRKLLLIIFSLLLLPGCWDRVEIEDASLIVGEAFDLGVEDSQETGGSFGQEEEKKQQKFINLTIQSVVPKPAGGQGGTPQKSYQNTYVKGRNVTELFFESTLKNDKVPFGHHLKVIVIGEQLARTMNIQHLLNELFRHPQVRRTSVVFIAPGLASKTFETKQPSSIPALGIFGMSDNHKRNTEILPQMTLGKVSYHLTTDSTFLLQNVVAEKGEAKFEGGSIIEGKSKKLIGYLNNQELSGINWLTGEVSQGSIVKAYDLQTDQVISIATRSTDSKIKPTIQGDKISFDVEIKVEASLKEDWMLSGDAFDNNYLKRNEEAIEREIKRLAEQALKKIQNEYQVDVAGFGTQLKIKDPKKWEKVKKDWDREFSKAPVNIHVKVYIRDYEMKGKKKPK